MNMIRDEASDWACWWRTCSQSAVLDSGDMRLKPVELDLHAVLRDVVRNTEVQVQRRERPRHLRSAGRGAPRHRRPHPPDQRLQQPAGQCGEVHRPGPLITVRTDSDTRGITVHITDNGIGIPGRNRTRSFERLYRVSTGDVHNVKGFGLRAQLRARRGPEARRPDPAGQRARPGQHLPHHLPFHHVSTDQAPAR